MSDSQLSVEQQISSIWDLGGLTWQELPRRVWGGIKKNDLVNRAYELAYNFLLAVFPLLLFLVALLWVLSGLAFLVGGEINSTIEHAAAEHGHPEAKSEGQKAA